jgi:hypothetical protein
MSKFKRGDLVRISDNLGPYMSHFPSGGKAVVEYSGRKYGCGSENYSLYIENKGSVAWYEESQLTLIKRNQLDILKQWKKEAAELRKKRSNIEWIFENGPELVRGSTVIPGDVIIGLGQCLGITEDDIWGTRGEGVEFYLNASQIYQAAEPYLEKKDKQGWIKFCESQKDNQRS